MNKKFFFIISLSLIVLAGCISPYFPTVTRYDDVLVVDGQLTNLPGPYKVKLTRSLKYNQKEEIPVNNATIKIIDDKGLEFQLKMNDNLNGVYSTTDSTFRGVTGKSYKLQIKVDGLIYESSFETLRKSVPIDKLYWEYKPQGENTPEGIQLLVDTHDPENTSKYYMWDFNETWKFRVPIYVTNKPEWIECYEYNPNKTFNINSTIKLHNDIIDRQPLTFIPKTTNRLYYRYTILAKQYTLSEQAYKYFEELVKSNLNQGSMFDPIPYSLVGNISCTTNKDAPVLGYFLVSGASEKRIFIDRSELPSGFKPATGFEDCEAHNIIVSNRLIDYDSDLEIDSLLHQGYIIFEKFDPYESGKIGLKLAIPRCYDCTLTGENKVPSFWVEK